MGSKLESLRSMKDEAKDHIDKSVELSEFSAEQTRSMSEIMSSLPMDVDDEILQAAKSVESGVQFDANDFSENEIKPELETGQQIMSEMTEKAREQIAKNDEVIDAFGKMDSIADFGSAARREGTQKAQSLNDSLFDLIEEGNQDLQEGTNYVAENIAQSFDDHLSEHSVESFGNSGFAGSNLGEGLYSSENSQNSLGLFGTFGNSNNDSSSNAMLYQHSQGIVDNYIKSDLNNYLSDSKKSGKLSDNVLYQNDKDFARGFGGNADMINGYNDGTKSYVKNSGPHPEKTAIHEYNHQLSANDVYSGNRVIEYRRGISINGRDTQVNEALTEFFTKSMMRNDYPSNPSVAYMDNEARIERMASGFGLENMKRAYYQNKPEILERRYDSIMGTGSWKMFSQAMDVSLDENSSYDDRKRANNYLDSMSMIFAAKSGGYI